MSSTTDIIISASLICADMCDLAKSIESLEDAGVDLLHIDIVDGRFSPSMPLGLELVRQLRAITNMPFDAHIMALNNEFFVDELARIGVQRLCFHIESTLHVDRLLNTVKSFGIETGIALLPTTPFSVLDYCLEHLDYVQLMLINPGYASHGNERQVPYATRRIFDCREYMKKRGVNIPIQVDGRVCFDTIKDIVAAGADIIVGGSRSLFDHKSSIRENVRMMRISASRSQLGDNFYA